MLPGPLLLLVLLAAAHAQTFQYSHGWSSGKRAADPDLLLMARVLTPCRWSKLKYALGAAADERLGPCDPDEEINPKKRHFKGDYNAEPLLDAFA